MVKQSDDVHWNMLTNICLLKKSFVIFLGFLNMIKLLVILFIAKLYAWNNIFKQKMKLSIKGFFNKCYKTAENWGFGHVYWRNI